jgi:hypothetical protein
MGAKITNIGCAASGLFSPSIPRFYPGGQRGARERGAARLVFPPPRHPGYNRGMSDDHLPLRIWALAVVIFMGEAVILLMAIAAGTIAAVEVAKIAADLIARWL